MGVAPARHRIHRSIGAVALLHAQIHQLHLLLDEQAEAALDAPRRPHCDDKQVLSIYVHALCVEDITVSVLLRNQAPLFQQIWLGGQLLPWDVTSARAYAQVVYAASDALLERLTPADLRRAVDLRSVGLGRPDATWVLNRFVVFEIAMACGGLSSIGRHASARLAAHRLAPLPHAVPSRNGVSGAAMQTARDSPALVQPPLRHVSQSRML